MLIITKDHTLDDISLEDTMDALGVKKTLNAESRDAIEYIRKISELGYAILHHKGKPRRMSPREFDMLYDWDLPTLKSKVEDFSFILQHLKSQH